MQPLAQVVVKTPDVVEVQEEVHKEMGNSPVPSSPRSPKPPAASEEEMPMLPRTKKRKNVEKVEKKGPGKGPGAKSLVAKAKTKVWKKAPTSSKAAP